MARRRLVLISILVGIAGGVFIVLAYRAQQTPTQRELFAQALNAGKTASERNYIFGEVAKAQANAGDYDAALSTILQIDRFAGQIPTEIVRIRLRKQDIEGAKKMLSQLPQSNLNNGARREIALAQASAGDLDGALKTTQGRFAPDLKDALANARLRAGDYEAALSTITQLASPDEPHDDVLYGIARELIQHGERRHAQQAIDRIRDPEIKRAAVPTSFENALAAHDLDQARIEARRLSDVERCDSLLDLAKQLIASGRMNDASNVLTEVTALAQQLSNRSTRSGILTRIAVLQVESGFSVDALPLLKNAPSNLCDVAWAYARKRNFAEADQLAKDGCRVIAEERYKAGDFDGAITRIRTEPNPSDQSIGFADLSKLAAQNGNVTHALRFAELIRIPAAHHEGEGYLAPALREVARAWAKSGKSYEAYRWARSRPTAYERAMALLGVGEAVR